MAKLFIGCDYIDFSYTNIEYRGMISKIILEEKTIYRVDYTCNKGDQSGRFEVSCIRDDSSNALSWTPHTNTSPDLASILQTAIEKNQYILQLEH
jgi:hypothetical protein